MKIPYNELAIVSKEKILNYILNEYHSDGMHKAKYFKSFGFSSENWTILVDALIDHCNVNEVSGTKENEFGVKYIVEGTLKTPDNRNPEIKTIWFIENNEKNPKFITAYPI